MTTQKHNAIPILTARPKLATTRVDEHGLRYDPLMADAPKFRFWWQHVAGTSVLQMPREDWKSLVGQSDGEAVEVDVRATPLGGVADVSSVVASVAHQFGPARARYSIYRYDEQDAPTPYNHDEYDVWTDLDAHPQLTEMIAAASTEDNRNFRSFAQENVFFTRREPGPEFCDRLVVTDDRPRGPGGWNAASDVDRRVGPDPVGLVAGGQPNAHTPANVVAPNIERSAGASAHRDSSAVRR